MVEEIKNRRPIKARSTVWAPRIASTMVRLKISPNAISLLSIVFALLSGISFVASSNFDSLAKSVLLFLGAVFIQFRLLCNLFDGMVAIEGGMKSKSSEVL